MADKEQVKMLRQGIKVWNKWRERFPNFRIDLTGADLSKVDLIGADLPRAELIRADLIGAFLANANLSRARLVEANLTTAHLLMADLTEAELTGANLTKTHLRGVTFRGADLTRTDLTEADLTEAKLTEANLTEVDLTGANLTGVDLTGADLTGANLTGAHLAGVVFTGADLGGTSFTNCEVVNATWGDNDLSNSFRLETIHHMGPSTIGTNTIRKSKGKIPLVFLRGCGLSDWEIEAAKLYSPDLSNEEINTIQYSLYDLRATQAVQISPLFISYSHADGRFVDKLEFMLNKDGIRFWRDIHDMKAGRLEKQIDHAIRHNPTVLLVLSKNSIKSDWVEHEVRIARDLEKQLEQDVLCPIALDDSWKKSLWPAHLMEQVMEYNILDCSDWEEDSRFIRIFRKLVDGLDLFYKKR